MTGATGRSLLIACLLWNVEVDVEHCMSWGCMPVCNFADFSRGLVRSQRMGGMMGFGFGREVHKGDVSWWGGGGVVG